MTVGAELVERLLERGVSKYQISKRLGVSWNTVNRWSTGESQPRQRCAITLKEWANEAL